MIAEIAKRTKIRTDLDAWCELALDHPIHPQKPAKHHRLLNSYLKDDSIKNLMIWMPPGSAKSTYASKLFPAWYMTQNPGKKVIGASYSSDLAKDFSGEVQGFIREHAVDLGASVATENKDLWSLTNGSRYRAVGVGGAVTGFRADLAIIDDPVKGREEADSERRRDIAWGWYRTDFASRLKPGGRQIIIQTRWHEDDLSGRLLRYEPDNWKVLSLPATALEGDPLGREPGELLWSDDPKYAFYETLRAAKRSAELSGAMRDWYSLYEQDPRPLDGGLINTTQIGVLDAAPASNRVVRAWDLASTAQMGTNDPDYTVGVKMLRTAEDRFVIVDIVRMRGGPEQVQAAVINTAAQDGRGCKVFLAQDPGQAGKAQILDYTRRLMGYQVLSERVTGDKSTRAAPFASQVNVGNVSMVRASWNAPMIEEMRSFPSGRHDDIVDAASDAFAQLIERGGVSRIKTLF